MATSTISVVPLTTTFTPPSGCLKSLDFATDSTISGVIPVYPQPTGHTSECMPSGWNPTSWFSPGVCPSGYTIYDGTSIEIVTTKTEYHAFCCPSGFEGHPSGSTAPCVSLSRIETMLVSSLSSETISVPTHFSQTVQAYGVSIRWQPSDFPTSSSTPLANKQTGLSTGSKAGIGAGVTFGFFICLVIALFSFFFYRHRRSKANQTDEQEPLQQASEEGNQETNQGEKVDKKPANSSSSFWDQIGLDTWIYEIVGLCFACICFAAMICILRVYENQPSPNLPYGVTLNTIISILATGSKSSLLFAVGECIGQLKWLAFETVKPLLFLQACDSASRGPWGSLLVLLRREQSFFMTVGALIVILALAFDPFVQQIIEYPLREVTRPSSSAAIKQPYNLPSIGSQGFIDAMNVALWSDDFTINPTCPTGNCTWPLYRSMEWCSKCENVTAKATLIGCDVSSFNTSLRKNASIPCNVALPQGEVAGNSINISLHDTVVGGWYNMWVPKDVIWTVDMVQWSAVTTERKFLNKSYLGVQNPLYVVAHAKLAPNGFDSSQWPSEIDKPFLIQEATQCIMSPCARTYNVSVSEGATSAEIIAEDFGSFHSPNSTGYQNGDTPVYWKPSTQPSSGGDETWYHVEGGYFRPSDMGFGVSAPQMLSMSAVDLDGYSTLNLFKGMYRENSSWTRDAGNSGSQKTIKIVDSGLGNVTRRLAASASKFSREDTQKMATGSISTEESFVSVNWPWLTLPAVLLLMGGILLVSTVLVNKQKSIGLWKSSILATLFHGLEKSSIEDHKDYRNASEMDHAAKHIRLKLESPDPQGRLRLQT